MKITTTQITPEEALRAVADGKSVQMIWTNDGKPFFSNFTEKIMDTMAVGEAFMIVDIVEDSVENPDEEIPTTVITDPDTTPITVAIPNSHKEERLKRAQLDDDEIVRLLGENVTQKDIAERLGVTEATIYNHVRKMRKEGRL